MQVQFARSGGDGGLGRHVISRVVYDQTRVPCTSTDCKEPANCLYYSSKLLNECEGELRQSQFLIFHHVTQDSSLGCEETVRSLKRQVVHLSRPLQRSNFMNLCRRA